MMLPRLVGSGKIAHVRALRSEFRRFTTAENVQPAKSKQKEISSYVLMGAILGGIGIGVPLSYLYLIERYELQWHKKLHGDVHPRVPK